MTTATEPTLLTFTCDPDELTASPPNGELSLARLRILVSNPLPTPVRCSRITIVLPVGTSAADLAETGVGITATASPHTWSVVAVQEDVLVAVPQHGTAEFVLSEHGVDGPGRADLITESLAIELNGIKVSRNAGTARITILESSATVDGGPETDRRGELRIFKSLARARRDAPPADGLKSAGEGPAEAEEVTSTVNFSARLPTSGGEADTKPATLVPPGQRAVLTWQGPPAEHTLYWAGKPNGDSIHFPYTTPQLTRDTTFVLKTTAGGIERFDSVTVTVDHPTLPGLRLDTLTGAPALTIQAPVTCDSTLTVTGKLTTDETCTAEQGVTANSLVTTDGLTSTAAVTTSGSSPEIVTGFLTVTGTLRSDDELDATRGKVSILGTPVVTPGAVSLPRRTATADGFLIVSSNGGWGIRAEGATVTFDDYQTDPLAAVPIHKGEAYQGQSLILDRTADFYFIPFGTP